MTNKQNPSSVWDTIWNNSSEFNSKELLKLIEETKQSETWRYYSSIVSEKFGGWNRVKSIEIGSGMGWHSLVAASEGASVCLLDYSKKALELAKQRFEVLGLDAHFIYGDAFDLAHNMKASFNLSWSFGTAEHFQDPLRQEFFNLHFDFLESGGISIISCPHAYAFNYRIWMFIAKKYGEWEFGLEVPYSKREYIQRLDKSSQKLIDILYDEGRPCLLKALNILKRKNKLLYILMLPLFTFFIKLDLDLHPFNKRSIILVAEKIFSSEEK